MMKSFFLLLLISFPCLSEEKKDFVDFNQIKDVLKNDLLNNEVAKKKEKAKKESVAKVKRDQSRFDFPREDNFWSFFSEYWLVKNAPIIKWDFKKPDYGIEVAFESFLEKLGYYEKRFKILLVNTPAIQHMALPSDNGELIFLLSVPFIKTLDLSKLEISLILFEDFLRVRANYFKKYILNKELSDSWGTNFYDKKFDKKLIQKTLEKYDEIIYVKGFNFQQQFEVTKQMNNSLKSDLKLWNVYLSMLEKIDNLVKTNILYQNYNKIYPSPEMQINWLKPKKERNF